MSDTPIPKLCTIGYAAAGAADRLEAFMTRPSAFLLDIRLHPVSRRFPAFCRPALEERYTWLYGWCPALGNLNADSLLGLSCVTYWLEQGSDVCLLCACANVEICHRKVVADLVCEQFSCTLVHL